VFPPLFVLLSSLGFFLSLSEKVEEEILSGWHLLSLIRRLPPFGEPFFLTLLSQSFFS